MTKYNQCRSEFRWFKMKMRSVLSLIVTMIVSSLIQSTYACSGYKLYVDYFRNCGKNDVIQLSDDFRPVLNDDCTITMNGCMTVKKPIKTSQVSYEFTKNGNHYSGTKNACHALETAHGEILSIMDSVDAPRSCPVKEGDICGHGKQVSIRKHRIKLPVMAGTTIGRMELKTNSGNSCFEFSATLNRHRIFSG